MIFREGYISRSLRWPSGYPRMLLLVVLVMESESHRGEILKLSAKILAVQKKGSTKCSMLLKRASGVDTSTLIQRELTREERAEVFSRSKRKARTVVGRKENSLLCDPGSE